MYASFTSIVELSTKLLVNLILAMNPPEEWLAEGGWLPVLDLEKLRKALKRVWFTMDWTSLLCCELFGLFRLFIGLVGWFFLSWFRFCYRFRETRLKWTYFPQAWQLPFSRPPFLSVPVEDLNIYSLNLSLIRFQSDIQVAVEALQIVWILLLA